MATPKMENVVREVLRHKLDPEGTIEPEVSEAVRTRPWIKPLAIVVAMVVGIALLVTLVQLIVGLLYWTLPLLLIGLAVWSYSRRDAGDEGASTES